MKTTTAGTPTMARKKGEQGSSPAGPGRTGRPKTSQRQDRTARIDATVLGWAEMVAKARGVTVAEYLSETLREPVWRDFGDLMRSMAPPTE